MELAPSTWGQLGLDAYEYFRIEMMTEFEEFRLSKGSWKLDRWAARAYVSWRQNIRRQEGETGKHSVWEEAETFKLSEAYSHLATARSIISVSSGLSGFVNGGIAFRVDRWSG
jgi:hypothetical protein